MKKFLVSIDTEGDNQWNWKKGNEIATENARYLSRFQQLCEKYGFKPTYLTNYEMAMSAEFQKMARQAIHNNAAEIGMHLHAWSTPPFVELSDSSFPNAPYLIEFNSEIMEQKIATMTSTLQELYSCKVTTHRSGRWALDDRYIHLLHKYGYKVDCSVTPGVSWSDNRGQSRNSHGSDYSDANRYPSVLVHGNDPLIEIPMTVVKTHRFFSPHRKDAKAYGGAVLRAVKGQFIWLRPLGNNLSHMKWIIDTVRADPDYDYAMFMLHSSEFMPGGNPTFRTPDEIDKLYLDIEELFKYSAPHFAGFTIGEYGDELLKKGGLA